MRSIRNMFQLFAIMERKLGLCRNVGASLEQNILAR